MHYKRNLKYGSPYVTQKDLSSRHEHKKMEEKFLANFNNTENPISCWIWQGTKTSRGYGSMGWRENNKIVTITAHRFAWEYYNKDKIPQGLLICHHCDNPLCVNPSHLFLGTAKDNIQDCMQKGRFKGGRKKPKIHVEHVIP